MQTLSHSNPRNLHKLIWAIALPAMLANLATALFGIADMWVIGRLGDAAAQGAVELGAKLLIGLMAVFTFLRTGTVALTAQAIGKQDDCGQWAVLLRALAAALAIGLALLLAKPWVIAPALDLFGAGQAVDANATRYLSIRYWSVPAWLLGAVLSGWLIGHRRLLAILLVEVGANLVHVALDLYFVLTLGWGVSGVAYATLVSEWAKLLALAWIVASHGALPQLARLTWQAQTWRAHALLTLLRINRDLFLRSLLLTASILMLTRGGALAGANTLAANGIIFQLFVVATLILDGFESPAQVLCGNAVGSVNAQHFRRLIRALLGWGLATGLAVALGFHVFGPSLAATFSTNPEVIASTRSYAVWLVVLPVLGAASFVLDGIFIGATWTRAMLATVGLGFAAYGLALYAFTPLGNHGLWLAYAILLAVRAAGQLAVLPRLIRNTFRIRPLADHPGPD